MLLSIVADDFGYCPNRNAAIMELYKQGKITDTSLLVNSTYAKQAAELAKEASFKMSLHFNMSEGTPISTLDLVPSLINADGFFYGKNGTEARVKSGQFSKSEIRKELSSQIEKFKELAGYYPQRIDGHQHFHIFPHVREVFAETLAEYGISITRIPYDVGDMSAHSLSQFLTTVKGFAKDSMDVFNHHNLRAPDAFMGCSTMNFDSKANLTAVNLKELLSQVSSDAKTCELMVHPGYPCQVKDGGCGDGPDSFSKDEGRRWELDFLRSDECSKLLEEMNIRLQSFSSQ